MTARDEWLSPEDLAEEFRVPVTTIYGWLQKHYGPQGIRVGRHVRYSRSEVERWVADQIQSTG